MTANIIETNSTPFETVDVDTVTVDIIENALFLGGDVKIGKVVPQMQVHINQGGRDELYRGKPLVKVLSCLQAIQQVLWHCLARFTMESEL